MTDPFLEAWKTFRSEVQSASSLLAADIKACTDDLSLQDRELMSRLESSAAWKLEAGSSDALIRLYEEYSKPLLTDTVSKMYRLKVDARLSDAFVDFRRRLDVAAGKLPAKASVSPKILIEDVEDSSGMSWWIEMARVRDRKRRVPVRAVVLDALGLEKHAQRALEGGFYLAEAQSALGLLDPWQLVHRFALQQVRGRTDENDAGRFEKAMQRWREQAEKRHAEVQGLVGQLTGRLSSLDGQLTQALLGRGQRSAQRRQREVYKACEDYWSRQRATVRGLVDIELSLVELARRSIRLTTDLMDTTEREYQSIVKELDNAIAGLEAWEIGQPDPLPPATAELAPAARRTLYWQRTVEKQARLLLPERLESVEPQRPVPGFREPWRTLEPRKIFLDAIEPARETTQQGCIDVERVHKSLLGEIDRAREVVAYSLQAIETETDGGDQIAIEGVANALALLGHQKEGTRNRTPGIEAALVNATASSFYQFLVAFELGRFSLASHLAREGVSRAGRRAARLVAERGVGAGRLAWSAIRRLYLWVLVSIGWMAPSGEGRKPVETWGYFGGHEASQSSVELPLIYDRLFRPEPVEDRRFLIGRDEEVAAMEEARDFWKAGRDAAILVDGERGSGKTSLLNCAVTGPFEGETIVRVSIRERLLKPDAVLAFVAEALQVPGSQVLSVLRQEPRVIVIEEAERTYLRSVDGLTGIRELLSLVAEGSDPNLWVLSLTSEACRFLDAALGLSRCFSHRLHASAVTSDELQDAILQRHNLSGLRLEFAAPPRKGRLQEWMRRQTARVQSPEEAFFEDLHEMSGGVFRSAFSIWRRHIDRVDAGVLHMNQLHSPDHSRLTQALSREDLFFLQMLLQHGSLTAQEDSEIFSCPLRTSKARIEHLIGRGILEPEPAAPGFRIQPEAGILVRAALNARNLI